MPLPDTTLIFLPSDYSDTNLFPAVFILHGLNANYHTWNEYTDLQNLADTFGFIIICPDGLKNSYYINSPKDSTICYIDFFKTDLLPQLQNNYKIDTNYRFITGNSMGGHGAIYIFLNLNSSFFACGSMSGVLDLTKSSMRESILQQLIGDYKTENELFRKFSVNYLINSYHYNNKEIIIHCGIDDPFFISNIDFVKECNQNKIICQGCFQKGGHTSNYWKLAIFEQMMIFRKIYINNLIE